MWFLRKPTNIYMQADRLGFTQAHKFKTYNPIILNSHV